MHVSAVLLALLVWACSPPSSVPSDADGDGDHDPDDALDVDVSDGDGPDADTLLCTGNGDGVIQVGEARPVLGASLVYLVNAEGSRPAVDVEGVIEEGRRTWIFDREAADDRRVVEEILDPADRWFAAHFPGATHASVVPGFESAVGVYRASDEGIALLGIASTDDDSTLISYDRPIFVVRFPASVGDTWTDEARATGRVEHVAFNAVESYTVTVDAAGTVRVPAGTFPTLRVRTEMDRRDAGPFDDHRITYVWIAECWGRVAYVGSASGESDPSFSNAEDYWRLALRE
jgi:hypothetical protein